MFLAQVETDSGEILNVLHHGNRQGGNLVLSFVIGLDAYCSEKRDDDRQLSPDFAGFSQMEAIPGESICSLSKLLINSLISGNWDYGEGDYEYFLKRTNDHTLTEDGFKASVLHARNAWTDIQLMMDGVEKIINALKGANLREDAWIVPELTLADFQALYNALKLAKERDAERVRINIE